MRKKDVPNTTAEILSDIFSESSSDGDLKKKDEESDSDNESKISSSQDDCGLNKEFENLHLSCANDIDNEGCDEVVVPKGLVSEKEARREKRAEEIKPYSVRQQTLTSGGSILDLKLNVPFDDSDVHRPIPVVEHDDSIHFTREEFLLLNEIYERNCPNDTVYHLPPTSPIPTSSVDISSCSSLENDLGYEGIRNRDDTESGYASNSPCPSVGSTNSSSPDSRTFQVHAGPEIFDYTNRHYKTKPMPPFYTKEHQFIEKPRPPINSLCVDLTCAAQNQTGVTEKPNITHLRHQYKEKSKNLQPATQFIVNDSDKVRPACERIQNKLLKRDKVQIHWLRVANEKPIEFLSIKNDKTKLMDELMCKEIPRDFNEIIYARTQRSKRHLENIPNIKYRDKEDRNALLIASLYHPQRPFIARLIADAYVELKISPDEVFALKNTILHILAARRDDYAEVLAELLHVTMKNGQKGFNVNSTNDESQTPLHVASKTHKPPSISTFVMTKLLIKHGANLSIQDKDGCTPLHLSITTHCDPNFIKSLLENPWARESVNVKDSMGNTPLHLAASRNDINLDRQIQVIDHLLTSNAQQIYNNLGKLPLALVVPQRREVSVSLVFIVGTQITCKYLDVHFWLRPEIRQILQNKGK